MSEQNTAEQNKAEGRPSADSEVAETTTEEGQSLLKAGRDKDRRSSQDKEGGFSLEKTRDWAKEHPVVIAVGSLAVGALIALGVSSSEGNSEGTTIRETTEVINPDGSREVDIEERFIPTERPESNEAHGVSENPTSQEVFDPDDYFTAERYLNYTPVEIEVLPYEYTESSSNAFVIIQEFIESNEEGTATGNRSDRLTNGWRGDVTTEIPSENGEVEFYVRFINPVILDIGDKIFLAAPQAHEGSIITAQIGEVVDGEFVYKNTRKLSSSGFGFELGLQWMAIENQEHSGQVVSYKPISLHNETLLVGDNLRAVIEGETIRPNHVLASRAYIFEDINKAYGGEGRSIDFVEDSESVFADYHRVD